MDLTTTAAIRLGFYITLVSLTHGTKIPSSLEVFTDKGSDSLVSFVRQLAKRELSGCAFTLFGTEVQEFESVTDALRNISFSFLSSPIQAFDSLPPVPATFESPFSRKTYKCNAYFFFLPNLESLVAPFYDFLNQNGTKLEWNFKGKVIFISLKRGQLETWRKISETYKGKKTLNVLSLWRTKTGDGYEIWTKWHYSYTPLRQLATYRRNEDFSKVDNYFPDKLQDLGGFPLVVKSFPHPPFIFGKVIKDGRFFPSSGFDIRFIETLAESLNFTIQWKHPGPLLWGRLLSDGTYSGMVGQIGADDGDIATANVFITEDRSRNVLFTYPYYFSTACFVTPAPRELPRWLSITYPFSTPVWIVILCCIIACIILLSALARLQTSNSILDTQFISITSSFMYILLSFTGKGEPTRSQSLSLQIYISCVALLAFLLTVSYSGNLTADLAVVSMEHPITTKEELYKSGYPVYGFSSDWIYAFRATGNKYYVLLSNRTIPTYDLTPIFRIVADRKAALIADVGYIKYTISTYYTTKTGETPLRIQEECFKSYIIGALLNKFSPLKERADKAIMQMHSGGLMLKFIKDVLLEHHNDSSISEGPSWVDVHGNEHLHLETNDLVLTLGHLIGAFIVYGICIFVSCVAFLGELLIYKLFKKK